MPTVREPGEGGPDEYKVKAAFLYNFIRFTKWPDDALGDKEDPIRILVVGEDRFGDHLTSTFKDKVLHERKVVIQFTKEVPKTIEAHLVFASAISSKDEEKLIERCSAKPILLIGDHTGFAARGACANFYLHDDKVRFQVNTDELKRRGLTMSAQILKLAEIVKTKKEEQE
ncbi:MAG: YfiR family protein [Planctomycetes bacterium]|nr:YfiR family protein [Planctomycetota bacterium]MCB9904324.1 YfiR family protein [Planctomycetota bacterium]